MASIVVAGDTSGSITLSAPAVAGTNTLTLPTLTATVAVNGPAFAATASGNQNISNSTWTKVNLATELFDTNSNFDTTNSRFTPTIAGYYQVNFLIRFDGTSLNTALCAVYKNNAVYAYGTSLATSGTFTQPMIAGSCILYMNGSTDYIELFGAGSASSALRFDATISTMSGSLVRAA